MEIKNEEKSYININFENNQIQIPLEEIILISPEEVEKIHNNEINDINNKEIIFNFKN